MHASRTLRSATSSTRGFSFVELLIGTAVFAMVSVSVYQSYVGMLSLVSLTRSKTVGAALANEIFEIAHNLPYASVGTVGGIPSGVLPPVQTIQRDGYIFFATTTVRNVDDPFDGKIGEVPNDLSPADYKFLEVAVGCPDCRDFTPFTFTSTIAPKSLETASTNGALFVEVFDANGIPIQGVTVRVENPASSIDITDQTNADGILQIVDAPPGVDAYRITVSKNGYSNDRTYPSGDLSNPNPAKIDATVLLQQVTQVSFALDQLSTMEVSSVLDTCAAVADFDFSLHGSKLVGTTPDIYKYDEVLETNASGLLTLANLEWDTYVLTPGDLNYDLIGTIPPLPIALSPASTYALMLTVTPTNPKQLLVSVKDAADGLPLADATVQVTGPSSYSSSQTTGKGFFGQTEWVGGAGQATSTNGTRYFDDDGNIETSISGVASLKQVLGEYVPSAILTSSSFDAGPNTNFSQVLIQPGSQPSDTGADSVRLQLATNDDGGVWNYLGPDGTASTYYTAAETSVNPVHNSDRYIRYKLFLSTASTTLTPSVSDVFFTFTSSCVPPGQVVFSGLDAGVYTVTVSKSGFQTSVGTIDVQAAEQSFEVLMTP